MNTQHKELARRMKDYRLDKGWTQVNLAAYLNVSPGTIARIEQGYDFNDLTARKIEKLLSANGVAA